MNDPDLPYVLVYREPAGRADAGTSRLISGEASVLVASSGGEAELSARVREIAEAGSI